MLPDIQLLHLFSSSPVFLFRRKESKFSMMEFERDFESLFFAILNNFILLCHDMRRLNWIQTINCMHKKCVNCECLCVHWVRMGRKKCVRIFSNRNLWCAIILMIQWRLPLLLLPPTRIGIAKGLFFAKCDYVNRSILSLRFSWGDAEFGAVCWKKWTFNGSHWMR